MRSLIILIALVTNATASLVYAQSNDTSLAKIFFNKGLDLLRIENKYDSAALYLKNSAYIFEENRMYAKSVSSYIQCGWAYYYNQDIDSSFFYINKSLKIGEKHFDYSTAEELAEMVTLHRYKGVLYKYLNDYPTALKYYNISLVYNEKLKKYDPLNYQINKSKIHYAIGIVYSINRNKKQALYNLRKSLEIQKTLPFDPDFNIALTYINIGNVYRKYEDFETAAQYYLEANRVITTKYNNYQNLKSFCINQLGAIYFDKGEYEKAIKYITENININIKIFGKDHLQVAMGYSNYALANKNIGKIDTSKLFFKKAYQIFLLNKGEYSNEVADIYYQLGMLSNFEENFQLSIEYLKKAYEIQRALFGEKSHSVSKTLYQLGIVYSNIEDYNTAINYFQKAIIAIVEDFNDINVVENPSKKNSIISKIDLLYPLQKKASLLHKLYLKNPIGFNKLVAALETYKLTFQLTNEMRIDTKSEEAKLILSENTRPAYTEAINIASEINDSEFGEQDSTIFHIMEEARNATLLSLIHEAKTLKMLGLPESISAMETELKKDLNYFEIQIEKLLNRKDRLDTIMLNSYKRRHFELFEQQDSLYNLIKIKYPRFNSLITNAKRVSIYEIQTNLETNSALIEYFTSDTILYVAVITKKSYHIEKISIDSSLKTLTINYLKNIKKGSSRKAFLKMSFDLYTKLIQPLKHHIENSEKLIIIPDEYLNYVPFETLCQSSHSKTNTISFSNLNYLIRNYEIIYNYSATLWYNGKLKSDLEQISEKNDDVFCAFAPVFIGNNDEINSDFFFKKNKATIAEHENDRIIFNELPYSLTEVETLSDLFIKNGYETKVYLNQRASEENFKNDIVNYKYIHIATHGISNDNPNLSGIVFSPSMRTNSKSYDNEGILFAGEMYNLNLSADLIVLSACESGIGKLRSGEGIMAIPRGLFYSGVPNIVMSLWKVSDIYTSTIMIDFYEGILKGNSYSHSLREAKIKMIKGKTTSFPKQWSGFILTGK